MAEGRLRDIVERGRKAKRSDEQDPLLAYHSLREGSRGVESPPAPSNPLRDLTGWRYIRGFLQGYLRLDIDTTYTHRVLIVCFFLAGMIDAGAYNAYGCFVHMVVRPCYVHV